MADRLGPASTTGAAQSAGKSWRECHLHARNLLGEAGYRTSWPTSRPKKRGEPTRHVGEPVTHTDNTCRKASFSNRQNSSALTSPFLTALDSRAAVKGSRDPLGIQQILDPAGSHVVGNLTTVSDSVRDFTTLLLGYYFAARLTDELGPETELATFLKWEQLAPTLGQQPTKRLCISAEPSECGRTHSGRLASHAVRRRHTKSSATRRSTDFWGLCRSMPACVWTRG
jgi:hypothetical protein